MHWLIEYLVPVDFIYNSTVSLTKPLLEFLLDQSTRGLFHLEQLKFFVFSRAVS